MMYAFAAELHMPFEKALEEVNQAIKEEGLGVVSDVDVQSIMRTKLQEDVAPYPGCLRAGFGETGDGRGPRRWRIASV
jgi:hypothetical protein